MFNCRVRFAPSPSGFMHIGNLRSALINYLYSKQERGSFILRIEDTDESRTEDKFLIKIYDYLKWANIFPDESPKVGGKFGPYIQSQRHAIYTNYLNICIEKKLVYRCFATLEELKEIKSSQEKLGLPSRYLRNKFLISAELEAEYLEKKKPFIWRFLIPKGETIFNDKVRGEMRYDLSHFADFPLTRENGTFTFIFANFVDDIEMKISYVMRGEEHLSNTVLQSVLYDILNFKKPEFYHLPLISDQQGKKLSKRDFGFSLEDLVKEGYISEAIINYLLLIGSSFEDKEEIFSFEEAVERKYFNAIISSGSIKYDVNKLLWINSEWIKKINIHLFRLKLREFLVDRLKLDLISDELLSEIKEESKTLKNAQEYIDIFLEDPILNNEIPFLNIINLLDKENITYKYIQDRFKDLSKENNIHLKDLWKSLRLLLTGKEKGMSLIKIINYIPLAVLQKRIFYKNK